MITVNLKQPHLSLAGASNAGNRIDFYYTTATARSGAEQSRAEPSVREQRAEQIEHSVSLSVALSCLCCIVYRALTELAPRASLALSLARCRRARCRCRCADDCDDCARLQQQRAAARLRPTTMPSAMRADPNGTERSALLVRVRCRAIFALPLKAARLVRQARSLAQSLHSTSACSQASRARCCDSPVRCWRRRRQLRVRSHRIAPVVHLHERTTASQCESALGELLTVSRMRGKNEYEE